MELEQALIGSLIQKPSAIIDVQNILKAGDLSPMPQKVYDALLNMFSSNKPIDILTVSIECKLDDPIWISNSVDIGIGPAATTYAAKIADKGKQRRILAGLENVQKSMVTFGTDEALNDLKGIYSNELGVEKKCPRPKCTMKRFNTFQEENVARGKLGELTGFGCFDDKMVFYIPNHCWVIGAEPGGGKSSFLIEQLVRCGNINVVVFSTEMSEEQIIARYASNLTGINSKIILSGKLKGDAVKKVAGAKQHFLSKRIRIYDNVYRLDQVENECRRAMIQDGNIDLVIVDFVQNCTVKGMSDEYAVQTELSRSLQALMKEVKACGVFYSQFPNDFIDNVKNGIKFKGSGGWRQVADLAGIVLNRPSDPNERLFDFRKHRHGPLFKQVFRFEDNYTRMEETFTQ
jgi:replicative DNA helicase